MSEKHNHYFRDCPYDKIDVYRIIDIFEITDPVAQHILKKCIATGKRGHKDEERCTIFFFYLFSILCALQRDRSPAKGYDSV